MDTLTFSLFYFFKLYGIEPMLTTMFLSHRHLSRSQDFVKITQKRRKDQTKVMTLAAKLLYKSGLSQNQKNEQITFGLRNIFTSDKRKKTSTSENESPYRLFFLMGAFFPSRKVVQEPKMGQLSYVSNFLDA